MNPTQAITLLDGMLPDDKRRTIEQMGPELVAALHSEATESKARARQRPESNTPVSWTRLARVSAWLLMLTTLVLGAGVFAWHESWTWLLLLVSVGSLAARGTYVLRTPGSDGRATLLGRADGFCASAIGSILLLEHILPGVAAPVVIAAALLSVPTPAAKDSAPPSAVPTIINTIPARRSDPDPS